MQPRLLFFGPTAFACALSLLVPAQESHAVTIASQDFGATNFPVDLNLDTQDDTVVTHVGSGASGTDLGFSANGITSTSGGNGFFRVTGGALEFIHFSSLSDVSTLPSTDSLSGATTVTFAQGTDHTAYVYTETVDLSAFVSKSFSMDVGDIVGATNTGDDDILVRLWVNGTTEVVLIDTRSNANGSLTYGQISHSFADGDTSAQLLVDVFTDDDNDGYRIDNILFEGTPSGVNQSPTVTINAPSDNETFENGTTVDITVTASDNDGTVDQVEFFVDGGSIFVDTAAPFEAQWTPPAVGNYELTAVATDDDNATATSPIVSVRILPVGFQTATFQEGFDGYASTVDTELQEGSPTSSFAEAPGISIDGLDSGGKNQGLVRFEDFIGIDAGQVPGGSTILSAKLRLFVFNPGSGFNAHRMLSDWSETDTWDSVVNGIQFDGVEATASPFLTLGADDNLENVPTGDLELDITPLVQAWVNGEVNYGIVFDPLPNGINGIDFDTSESSFANDRPELIIEYVPGTNLPPTIALTSPADASSFDPPANISLAANASDPDGTVSKVEFFVDATKLGEDTTAPYTFEWTNVIAAGTYTLTAVATDNLFARTTSAPVTITVEADPPPTIALVSPADGAVDIGPGGSVTLEATVNDPEDQPLTVTFFGREKSPPPGPDFTLVAIPDTQNYTDVNQDQDNLPNFVNQTNWIVSAKDSLNIAFVSHLGDVAQSYNTQIQEYINADQAMSVIEDPVTTLLADGIPWGVTPGNHDISLDGQQDTSLFNQFFGISRFQGRGYYQGNYGTNNDNNYQFFSASGLDFIVVNIKYNAGIVEPAIIDWADAVLKAHPNRRAIVTSHNFLTAGNPAPWHGHGQFVYEQLRDNPNLFMMLCGHRQEEGIRTETFNGNTVYVLLSDYQGRPGGGDSWLRYYVFSPANNTITAKTFQTRTGLFETDANSEFTLPYDMGQSLEDWVEIETINLAGGENTATIQWNNLAPETEYEWYAAVTDGVTPVASGVRSFTVTMNDSPLVTLDAPAGGSEIVKPATVDFAATANDPDGSIQRVEFYADDMLVGEDTTSPYAFAWPAPSGTYVLRARAVDNQDFTADSNTATVTVVNPNNEAPVVALTSPSDGSDFTAGTIALTADASDSDGFVTKVEFFANGILFGEDTEAPYEVSWLAETAGGFALTAVATDNDGATTTSAAVNVFVEPVTLAVFRQGLDGYAGAIDTQIREDAPDTSFATASQLSIDSLDGSGPNHILLEFGDIIGDGPLQIPAGSTITAAALTLEVTDPGSGFTLHQVLLPWSDTDTWNSAFGGDGVQTDDVEASSTVITTQVDVGTGRLDSDVRALVQAWASGAPNNGLVLLPTGTNGIDFYTSDFGFDPDVRPTLTVELVRPVTVSIFATDATASEFGGDSGLTFTILRTGDTGAALPVSLAAAGSATSGSDYSGFNSIFTVPAGLSNDALQLTVLEDDAAEGSETVSISVQNDAAYDLGTPATAIATITDKPSQDFFFNNIADPGKRDPGDDADGDNAVNFIEFYFGTDLNDAASRPEIIPVAFDGTTAVVRFQRNKGAIDATGKMEWSTDLITWYPSGSGNSAITVSFALNVLQDNGDGTELVEAVGDITGEVTPTEFFLRIEVTD